MNIDENILNKIFANSTTIQQYNKIKWMQDGAIYKNKSILHNTSVERKDKIHMIISIRAEKVFDKIQHPIMIKIYSKIGVDRTSKSYL